MSNARPRTVVGGTGAPPYHWLALERLSVLEYGSFVAASPLLRFLPKGDGHPVIVLPGFYASDDSTERLRAALRRNGHAVRGWGLGTNTGPHPQALAAASRRLHELHRRDGRTVSLVGWSLGGVIARELGRAHPERVRQVITLAAPFRSRPGNWGHAARRLDRPPRPDPRFAGRHLPEDERPALLVPSTAIYTRTDGLVHWQDCIGAPGPRHENIEVFGTHTGLGCNISATIAVADRLAQPEGEWAPFRPTPALGHLYPAPVTWSPADPS